MNFPEDDGEEIWPFEDAPRWFMLDAGGKIPDLLETLVKRTNETIAKVTKRKNETAELALTLSVLANGMPEPTKEGK